MKVRTVLSASVALSLVLLAGRITGLLRELGLASVFGLTPEADLAVLLLTMPDLLVNLLISGGISAALVPRFSVLPPDQAQALFRRVSALVLTLFSLAGLTFVAWPEALFFLLAPGLDAAHPDLATLGAVALALPLTGMAGVTGAYLNAQQRFLVVGCGTLLFNAGVLAALAAARQTTNPLALLSAGIAAGAVLRLAAQALLLPRSRLGGRVKVRLLDRTLLRAFALATLASGLTLLAPIIVRAMASTLGPGAIASFNYAQKLVELPVTILISSICTVALSQLSVLNGKGEQGAVAASALRDARYAVMVGLTVMLFGVWFSDAVVQTIFGYGKMDAAALDRIAELTALAILGVPCIALSSMASACLNATGRVQAVFTITASSLLILPVLALPGLLLGSELALMLAVVGFQAVSAAWLARRAGLPLAGEQGVMSVLATSHFARIVALAAVCMALDAAFAPYNHWLRVALAGAGFIGAMALPVRRFLLSIKPVPASLAS